MSNRKDLKHSVNTICQGLLAECVATSLYVGNVNQDDADAILTCILKMQRQFVSRIGHPEPGLSKKAYYANLTADFKKQVNEVVDQINNLC